MNYQSCNRRGVPIPRVGGFPRFILFSGKFGTGKDTFASILKEHIAKNSVDVQELKFAKTLKDSSAIILDLPQESMYSESGKKQQVVSLGYSVGRFQQLFGEVLRNGIHQDIFVFPVISGCQKYPTSVILVTDCRFENEARLCQEVGGIVIRLNRNADLISESCVAGRDRNHISETALDDYEYFDLIVDNNETIADAWNAILDFIHG